MIDQGFVGNISQEDLNEKGKRKLHHYVPIWFQRGFTDDDGLLWTADKNHGEPQRISPKTLFAENRLNRCFRNQLLLLNTYLVLTKPLSHDIQCQRCVSVKIGCKYLDNWSLSSLRQHWMTEAPDRNARRALEPLRGAPALAPRPDRRTRAPGAHPPAVQAPDGASPDAHLGPGERDGRTCAVHHRHADRRLLLRPPQPLAAWHQREQQRLAPSVLPKERRPQPLHLSRIERRRPRAQQSTSTNVGLDESIRSV